MAAKVIWNSGWATAVIKFLSMMIVQSLARAFTSFYIPKPSSKNSKNLGCLHAFGVALYHLAILPAVLSTTKRQMV
ncbi:hypothetical protein [Tateyamaria sp.]|uniref:hypothetical protein n=1 Tax=Tateyamaria sp. TaxID=1929288 RepID=UPI00329F09E8